MLTFGMLVAGEYPSYAQSQSALSVDGPTLKDVYFDQAGAPLRKMQECEKVISFFNAQQLDKFTSNGSRVIGIDLHGKVWEVKKNSSGMCALENIARLEVPARQKTIFGEVEEIVFYYEPRSVCSYSQDVGLYQRVRRLCYQPIGVVNKFAPYDSP